MDQLLDTLFSTHGILALGWIFFVLKWWESRQITATLQAALQKAYEQRVTDAKEVQQLYAELAQASTTAAVELKGLLQLLLHQERG